MNHAQRKAYIEARTMPANASLSDHARVAGSLVNFVRDRYGLEAYQAVCSELGTWVIGCACPDNPNRTEWRTLEYIEQHYEPLPSVEAA